MYKIFYWLTAIIFITWWLSLADEKSRANDSYWSVKVEQCSKVAGFMNQKGECEIN